MSNVLPTRFSKFDNQCQAESQLLRIPVLRLWVPQPRQRSLPDLLHRLLPWWRVHHIRQWGKFWPNNKEYTAQVMLGFVNDWNGKWRKDRSDGSSLPKGFSEVNDAWCFNSLTIQITKCTFHKFGASGSVQKFDGICVLPLNIINEKIYVFLWFWFVILAVSIIRVFLNSLFNLHNQN